MPNEIFCSSRLIPRTTASISWSALSTSAGLAMRLVQDSSVTCTKPSTPGQACEKCGDGIVAGGEVCDDANLNDADGCSNNCRQIDPAYSCPIAGQPCEQCGNG